MSSIIKVNTFQDANGNALFSSDGSGTVTLDSNFSGVLPDNTPAIMARPSGSQSISNATWTKVEFSTEDLDTNSNFASHRFTPTSAGYYCVNLKVSLDELNDQKRTDIQIYKNGSGIVRDATQASMSGGNSFVSAMISGYIVQMNGSSDYLEGYVYQDHGSNRNTRSTETFFSAYKIIGA